MIISDGERGDQKPCAGDVHSEVSGGLGQQASDHELGGAHQEDARGDHVDHPRQPRGGRVLGTSQGRRHRLGPFQIALSIAAVLR
jgi:hypothetical protein